MPGCLLDIYVTVLPDATEARSQDIMGTAYSTVASQLWMATSATSAAVRHLVTNRWTSAGGGGILVPISH